MIAFVNRLELNSQIYQINGSVKNINYKGNFLFSMKDFV